MTRKAYLPEENLFGIKTVVTDKSKEGLPNGISREPETNLPPGAATPNSVRQPDTADGNGRVLAEHGPGYNTPGTGEPGPFEHPRTVGVPGAQEGSPTKFDYNMLTRRTMTAYEPRMPWKRQRKQPVWDRLESKRDYQENKSKIKHRSRLWYKHVHKNQNFQTKKQNRRDDPEKYERRTVGEAHMATEIEAYTPTPLSTRRRRQHGPARAKSHRNYIRNRAKAHRRQHIWYQRNKNKPAFKRRTQLRRTHPQRFRMRPGAYVPGTDIEFVFGPDMTLGRVDSVSSDAVAFSPLEGDANDLPHLLSPAAFLHGVVFDSPESKMAMFEVLDDQVGVEAYEDLTQDDLSDIASLYGVALPEVFLTDPEVLSAQARQIVESAMEGWEDPTPMAARVASKHLEALGEIHLYDQGRPTSHDQAKMVERVILPHEPTPGGYEKPEESGVSAPASSAKVIPDSMKMASGWQEVNDEDDGHYYIWKTPEGRYLFRHLMTWEGEEKPTGDLVWTDRIVGEQNLGEYTLDGAKRRADEHYKKFLQTQAEQKAEEKKEHTLREQLLDFAKRFRSSKGDDKAHYKLLLQQATDLGMIDEPLRRKLNKHNKQMGSLKGGGTPDSELMAQGLEMIVYESKHELLRTAATIADIEKHVAADVAKRARSVKVSLARADQKNGIWTFRATGSEGRNYTVKLKAERVGTTKDVSKLQVRVSCDCDFFRYQGPEHWASTNGYLLGKPRGTASTPHEKDASGQHWLCKHASRVLALARSFRVAGEGSWWPVDAEIIPTFCGPSASRVAARYGGA